MANRIPIHVSNHTALVWDVDHVATLRSKHRICGVLSGTLPNLSQQNIFLGLPLVLTPEELVLLLEKQLAMIVHDPSAHHAPTPAQLEAWDASRRQDIAQHQLARLDRQQRQRRSKAEDRRTTPTTAAAPIDIAQDPLTTTTATTIQQKRVEREARRRRRLAETADPDPDPDAGADADAEPDDADAETTDTAEAIGVGVGGGGTVFVPAATPIPSGSSVYTVSVPTTSDGFAWYNYIDVDGDGDGDDDDDPASDPQRRRNQPQRTYETLDAARAAGVWSYPSNADERARCEVFRDLWEKGYYMGGGIKFGGDWLVYPGDPLRYHSHFVATVQAFPSAPLRPMEVVAHGRLGTATKKAHLLCGWDPESRDVTYISIEWAGFG